MSKTISIAYKGKTYNLEYTRKTVTQMEKSGFSLGDIESKPISTLPVLFAGAFLAHHSLVRADMIEEMFNGIKNKSELIRTLAEMYNAPLVDLFDEPEEDDEGNAEWTVNE